MLPASGSTLIQLCIKPSGLSGRWEGVSGRAKGGLERFQLPLERVSVFSEQLPKDPGEQPGLNPYYFLGLGGKRGAEWDVGAVDISSSSLWPGPLPRLHLSVLLWRPSDVLMVTWCKASDSQIPETLIPLAVSIATRAGQGRELKASIETAALCHVSPQV